MTMHLKIEKGLASFARNFWRKVLPEFGCQDEPLLLSRRVLNEMRQRTHPDLDSSQFEQLFICPFAETIKDGYRIYLYEVRNFVANQSLMLPDVLVFNQTDADRRIADLERQLRRLRKDKERLRRRAYSQAGRQPLIRLLIDNLRKELEQMDFSQTVMRESIILVNKSNFLIRIDNFYATLGGEEVTKPHFEFDACVSCASFEVSMGNVTLTEITNAELRRVIVREFKKVIHKKIAWMKKEWV